MQGASLSNAFKLPVHAANKNFALNPYRPGTAACMDTVCFSLINGSLPSRHKAGVAANSAPRPAA